jgi:hypothetical protein
MTKMIIYPKRVKVFLFIAACLFLKGLVVSDAAAASNEVFKIIAEGGGDRTRIMLSFKERPSYKLYAVSEGHILLTFHDTIKGAAFENYIPEGNMLSLSESKSPPGLNFDINLQNLFQLLTAPGLRTGKSFTLKYPLQVSLLRL